MGCQQYNVHCQRVSVTRAVFAFSSGVICCWNQSFIAIDSSSQNFCKTSLGGGSVLTWQLRCVLVKCDWNCWRNCSTNVGPKQAQPRFVSWTNGIGSSGLLPWISLRTKRNSGLSLPIMTSMKHSLATFSNGIRVDEANSLSLSTIERLAILSKTCACDGDVNSELFKTSHKKMYKGRMLFIFSSSCPCYSQVQRLSLQIKFSCSTFRSIESCWAKLYIYFQAFTPIVNQRWKDH